MKFNLEILKVIPLVACIVASLWTKVFILPCYKEIIIYQDQVSISRWSLLFLSPPRLPLVAPGQDARLHSTLPYESCSSTQLSCRSGASASWQLRAAGRPCRQRWKAAPVLFSTAFPSQDRGEQRARWKEFIRDATEVRDCLEGKAEVKIENRKSARVVPTGAGALTADRQTSHFPGRRAIVAESAHSDWF